MGLRMLKWKVVVCMLVAVMMLPLSVLAQGDLSETFIAEDGSVSFMYPAGWAVQTDASGMIGLSNSAEAFAVGQPGTGEVIMLVMPPEFFADAGVENTLDGVLAAFIDSVDADEISEPEPVDIGERSGLGVELVAGELSSVAVALPFSDGNAGLVTATVLGEGDDLADTILAIMVTVDRAGTSPVAAKPCEVSTEVRWGAPLRVGPGENRTELTTLAVNKWFPVTGQAEADDGSLWWQLDKEVVAPGSAATELWVKQDDVDERGDCARVGDAAAPPIIPIVQAPPPPPKDEAPAQGAPPVAPTNSGTGVWIDFPEWNSQLPAGMKAASRSTARVAIQVVPTLQTEASAPYIKWDNSITTVYRNRVVYNLTAINPATNAVIATYQVRGGDPPPFPASMPINATLNGSVPTLGDAMGWIQGLLG